MLFYTDADDRPAYREKIVAAGIFIAIDVSASQFPQLPVPRYSPEQVGGHRANQRFAGTISLEATYRSTGASIGSVVRGTEKLFNGIARPSPQALR